jgi:hypothetical protein
MQSVDLLSAGYPLKVNLRFAEICRLHLQDWRVTSMKQVTSSKCRSTFNVLHGILYQMTELLMITAVRISKPTALITWHRTTRLWSGQTWKWPWSIIKALSQLRIGCGKAWYLGTMSLPNNAFYYLLDYRDCINALRRFGWGVTSRAEAINAWNFTYTTHMYVLMLPRQVQPPSRWISAACGLTDMLSPNPPVGIWHLPILLLVALRSWKRELITRMTCTIILHFNTDQPETNYLGTCKCDAS